uniref:UBA domain-containing protein n=1 Tax=Angiostrongylus cantonensis TaxID=6313 RepID=A0A0K0DQD3_ANGCA
LTLFANFISLSVPDNLKLLSYSFNLLEMGYSRQEVARLLVKERKRLVLDSIEMDVRPKRPRSSLAVTELPSAESYSSTRETTNGHQSDDEV